jgi:beta-N-acetylhexosaminidase
MPAAAVVAQAAMHAGRWRLAREHGRLIAREARALGFNTVFAPVLDLRTERSQSVMRTRVASDDPEHVARYGAEFLKGLHREHIVGCGKHFPGLGHGAVDSHESTPSIEANWHELAARDLLPYRRLRRRLPMVMVAHARYPQASPRKEVDMPASVSRFWIERVLQDRIGFRGLVVSDDMEMGGILHHAPIEEAAVAALAAGTHLVEICKDPALLFRAYEAILREAENSRAFRRILRRAAGKVREAKQHLLGSDRLASAPAAEDVQRLRAAVEDFSAEVHRLASSRSTPVA